MGWGSEREREIEIVIMLSQITENCLVALTENLMSLSGYDVLTRSSLYFRICGKKKKKEFITMEVTMAGLVVAHFTVESISTCCS